MAEFMEAASSLTFGVWFLVGTAMVFFMQCGFAMVEAGFTRAKNAGNIIMKNLMDFCIGSVVFVTLGSGLMLAEDYIAGMTVTKVLGCGIQKGKTGYYRGVKIESMDLNPKVQVYIVVSAVPVRTLIKAAKKALYTGSIGDGKIFVYDVENVVKVRTGEEGYDALQGDEQF